MKKVLFLALLLTFSLAACSKGEEEIPGEDIEATLDEAISIIDEHSPIESLEIEEESDSEKHRVIKAYLEDIDALDALDIFIAITTIDEETFRITVSKDTLNKSTEIVVSHFELINIDFEAIVDEAIDRIDAVDEFLTLEISEDTEAQKEEAIVNFLQSLDGMEALRVALNATYNADEWQYEISVTRGDITKETTFSGVYFKVVKPVVDEFLYDMVNAVRDHFGENYNPNSPISEQQLSEMYGFDLDWMHDFYAEGPAFTMAVDMFIGISAKEGHIDDVEAALLAYQDYLINDSFQYPMNMAKVQASQVHIVGNYGFLILLSDHIEDEEVDAVEHFKAINQEAIDIINGVFNNN